MNRYKQNVREIVVGEVRNLIEKTQGNAGVFQDDMVTAEFPPRSELGDLAFPMFGFAKLLRKAPQAIAVELASALRGKLQGDALAEGPYVNIKLDRAQVSGEVLASVRAVRGVDEARYGSTRSLAGRKIMIEFSCPNTNKPLHLGHLRNDAIGESVAKILAANGAVVRKVNLINDRGIHICKSMLAYTKFGGGKTPESEGIKSDHFVGDYYVKYAEWEKQDKQAAEEGARRMLKAWEDGDPATIELWKTMNRWAIDGIKVTYASTNISFDAYYFESETYLSGRDEILRGLSEGIFTREADSSVQVDLTEYGLDRKVLLRADGTSLYMTQDIGTAVLRHKDWPFERLIYVVACEQNYHFQVLFKVLGLLGYEWAKQLHHLSYGMVNLPSGKMKSREGTVVDADNLLDELIALADKEIRDREREGEIEDVAGTTKAVALGALNYYLLGTTPSKDMVFNPEESISFTGNTGPYLQYTGARISSILRKFDERKDAYAAGQSDPALLTVADEWELVKFVAGFPDAVETAGRDLNPSMIALHLYELAKTFSRYYHDNPILHNENPNIVVTRIELLRAIRDVFESGFALIGVPFLERM